MWFLIVFVLITLFLTSQHVWDLPEYITFLGRMAERCATGASCLDDRQLQPTGLIGRPSLTPQLFPGTPRYLGIIIQKVTL
jgi:hypothetical protein